MPTPPLPKTILFVFGTRPEAIKLAPVIRRLREQPERFSARVCVTAQHRELLDRVLEVFGLQPDYDLDVMRPGQTLSESTARILAALDPVLLRESPDYVLVQGDTTTAFCGALAAFYRGAPVAHVEAGLRTGDMRQPFPEELNRVLVSKLAALHFAPTAGSVRNLRNEGISAESVFVTGNTGIDAVLEVCADLAAGRLRATGLPQLDASKKLILVTAHRRESFGEGFERICVALAQLAARGDVELVYPVHPNPNVQDPVNRHLSGRPSVHLIAPLDYLNFVALMQRAHFLLTDSGGIQEEAPSLGKPVLVLREKTERPEAVDAGTARLVGTDPEKILAESALLLDNATEYERRARIHNPYGDGTASLQIREILANAAPGNS